MPVSLSSNTFRSIWLADRRHCQPAVAERRAQRRTGLPDRSAVSGAGAGRPDRVRQIVSNLLSNALKFTRFGRVDVRLSTFEEGVRIEVCDTGIGIAQDAQVKIFQPFTQAGAGITRQFGGTGWGWP